MAAVCDGAGLATSAQGLALWAGAHPARGRERRVASAYAEHAGRPSWADSRDTVDRPRDGVEPQYHQESPSNARADMNRNFSTTPSFEASSLHSGVAATSDTRPGRIPTIFGAADGGAPPLRQLRVLDRRDDGHAAQLPPVLRAAWRRRGLW